MAAVVRCALPSAVLPGVRWYFLDGAAEDGDDASKWAPLGDVSKALRVSVRALQQWLAPDRDLQAYDVSDALRIVPYARLPPELKTRRGRSMISSPALEIYLRTVHGRYGRQRRSAHTEADLRQILPLAAPHVTLDADLVFFNGGNGCPRDRFVPEWLEPLAAQLGYALVPLASVATAAAAAPSSPSDPVNVCQVKSKRRPVQ